MIGCLANGNYYNFSNYLTVVVYDRPFQGSNDHDISRKSFNDGFKKIILTTDPKLISDGVDAIDDTFLEWFIKNPTCAFVECELVEDLLGVIVNKENLINQEPAFFSYKIIIPETICEDDKNIIKKE